MSEKSSFNIEPNLQGPTGDKAKELYAQHKQEPNNLEPIKEAKAHYEQNREAYHNQAAMDVSASGKDVNTDRIKHSTTTENGVTNQTTKLTGDFGGNVNVGMDKGNSTIRIEGANIKNGTNISNRPPKDEDSIW
jgi:hypothetical protein